MVRVCRDQRSEHLNTKKKIFHLTNEYTMLLICCFFCGISTLFKKDFSLGVDLRLKLVRNNSKLDNSKL